MKQIERILDFAFPNNTCLVCKCEINVSENKYICDKCASVLPINTEPPELSNSAVKQYFRTASAPFLYQKPIRDLILELKYSAGGDTAKIFAPYMAAVYEKIVPLKTPALEKSDNIKLVPVPLFSKRKNWRGYNQSEILATDLSLYLNIDVLNEVLIRTKKTPPLRDVSLMQKAEYLKNAFSVTDKTKIRGKHIILIDDVFTSGTTSNECAKTLLSAGAKSVDVLVAAYAV